MHNEVSEAGGKTILLCPQFQSVCNGGSGATLRLCDGGLVRTSGGQHAGVGPSKVLGPGYCCPSTPAGSRQPERSSRTREEAVQLPTVYL